MSPLEFGTVSGFAERVFIGMATADDGNWTSLAKIHQPSFRFGLAFQSHVDMPSVPILRKLAVHPLRQASDVGNCLT
jgi:hypothetical protein